MLTSSLFLFLEKGEICRIYFLPNAQIMYPSILLHLVLKIYTLLNDSLDLSILTYYSTSFSKSSAVVLSMPNSSYAKYYLVHSNYYFYFYFLLLSNLSY